MAKKLLDYNIQDLYEWMDNGKSSGMPEDFIRYVNLLDKVRSMKLRPDVYGNKETIIKHLMTFEPDLKGNRIKAAELYAESIEYFYTQESISKKAWRNLYADELDKNYDLAVALAKNASDLEKAARIKEKAAKIRGLDQEDPEKLPDSFYQRPFKVYTMDLDMFEQGKVDRNEAIEWIEENTKKLTPKAIDRIKQEAMITPIKIFQDEAEDPRKD